MEHSFGRNVKPYQISVLMRFAFPFVVVGGWLVSMIRLCPRIIAYRFFQFLPIDERRS